MDDVSFLYFCTHKPIAIRTTGYVTCQLFQFVVEFLFPYLLFRPSFIPDAPRTPVPRTRRNPPSPAPPSRPCSIRRGIVARVQIDRTVVSCASGPPGPSMVDSVYRTRPVCSFCFRVYRINTLPLHFYLSARDRASCSKTNRGFSLYFSIALNSPVKVSANFCRLAFDASTSSLFSTDGLQNVMLLSAPPVMSTDLMQSVSFVRLHSIMSIENAMLYH